MEEFQWIAVSEALPEMGLAFVSCALILLFLLWLPLLKVESARTEKKRPRPFSLFLRLGGVALILSFWFAFFFDTKLSLTPALMALVVGSFCVFFFGVLDDLYALPWYVQLFFQIGLASLLLSFGLRIEMMQGLFGGTWDLRQSLLPGLPALMVVLWVILIMNSLNWIDGEDGLLGSISLIGFLTLFCVSLFPEVRQPAVGILALIFAGSLAAFLLFNLPPARILAGTTGAYFLGFSLAALSIFSGAKVATALLVLTVPILDALFVLGERLSLRQSPFLPDKRHLHYRLKEIGWSEKKILLFYAFLTATMSILALVTRTSGKAIVFFIFGSFMIILLFTVRSLTRHKSISSL